MEYQFKFVSGDGSGTHEKAIEEAFRNGYVVKFVSCDPSSQALNASKTIVVLMEKARTRKT